MRAFPVVYVRDVARAAAFWELFGFQRRYAFPADDPGYVSLRRDDCDVAVTNAAWARDQYGLTLGDGPRFEMFVYVGDVDDVVATLEGHGVPVLRVPADMPWGERMATVLDPDGNPVSLANAPADDIRSES